MPTNAAQQDRFAVFFQFNDDYVRVPVTFYASRTHTHTRVFHNGARPNRGRHDVRVRTPTRLVPSSHVIMLSYYCIHVMCIQCRCIFLFTFLPRHTCVFSSFKSSRTIRVFIFFVVFYNLQFLYTVVFSFFFSRTMGISKRISAEPSLYRHIRARQIDCTRVAYDDRNCGHPRACVCVQQ